MSSCGRATWPAVSQREYDAWVDELEGVEHVHGVERWRDAHVGLFGETPLAIWGACPDVARTCLRSFLCEKLPNSVFRAAFAMMVLEQGTFHDLDALGAMPTGEELLMLADDYGFLHIDLEAQRFRVPSVELEALKGVIDEAGLGRILLSESDTTMERMLSMLVEDDRVGRVQEILAAFYSERRCISWVRESGWRLARQERDGAGRHAARHGVAGAGTRCSRACGHAGVVRRARGQRERGGILRPEVPARGLGTRASGACACSLAWRFTRSTAEDQSCTPHSSPRSCVRRKTGWSSCAR